MRDFHKRFNIKVNIEEAREKFVNRAISEGFESLLNKHRYGGNGERIERRIVYALGERYDYHLPLYVYIDNDFLNTLKALEAFYWKDEVNVYSDVGIFIEKLISDSEVDLGIRWKDGHFYPSGAKELDEALVNYPLEWLHNKGYDAVIAPFEKGLRHFLETIKKPELLSDVITDMYEALESLSKIITGRKKDLSANRELFLKQVSASDEYKVILKQYIEYANKFRHAVTKSEDRPNLSRDEVESFIYLTGLFIRLATAK